MYPIEHTSATTCMVKSVHRYRSSTAASRFMMKSRQKLQTLAKNAIQLNSLPRCNPTAVNFRLNSALFLKSVFKNNCSESLWINCIVRFNKHPSVIIFPSTAQGTCLIIVILSPILIGLIKYCVSLLTLSTTLALLTSLGMIWMPFAFHGSN